MASNAPCRSETLAWERSGHTAVVSDNVLYVWGGYVSVADHEVFLPNDEIWLYDLESGLWERFDMGGEIPPSMSGMCGCVLKGHMYIFGGCGDDGQTNEHYLVNLSDGRYFWKKIRHHSGFLPSPRDKLSCWVDKSRIIYFGGYGHKLLSEIDNPRTFIVDEASWAEDIFWGWNNEVHVFDSETQSWNSPTTFKHHLFRARVRIALTLHPYHAPVQVNRALAHLFKRARAWFSVPCPGTVSSDHTSQTSRALRGNHARAQHRFSSGRAPAPRAAHASATINNKGYICGGRKMETRTSDVYCLDLETWTWSEIVPTTTVPQGRSWHTLTAVSETSLFLYGGLSMDCRPMSDGWMFDLKTKGWTEMKHLDMDKPRLWHTACLGRDSDVIVFGGSHDYIILVDSGHCNDILVFQTHPYSLVRLCEDFIASHTDIFQSQVACLPSKLRQAVEKRTAFFHSVKKSQKLFRTLE